MTGERLPPELTVAILRRLHKERLARLARQRAEDRELARAGERAGKLRRLFGDRLK